MPHSPSEGKRRTRRARLILLAVAALMVVAATTVRIAGVTGNLWPVLRWRWSTEPDLAVLSPTGARVDVSPTLGDWPQLLGPRRDGVVDGVLLEPDWSRHPPELVWQRRIGSGWASFAVQGDIAVTLEQRGEYELVVAYALETGEPIWVHADRTRYESLLAGAGPRSTPAIAGEFVFTMGATGRLNALSLATGTRIWSHDVVAETGAQVPAWGKSCSPLVLTNRVIVSAGGVVGNSLLAYDTRTGDRLWSGGDDPSSYASPLVATLAGVQQVVMLNRASITGHDPATGAVLWRDALPDSTAYVAQPLPIGGDGLLVASGQGIRRIRLVHAPDGSLRAEPVWQSRELRSLISNFVLYQDHIYGLDDGVLTCLDAATGARSWRRGQYGHGQIVRAEDVLLIQAENGDLVLVAPRPDGLRQLARAGALHDKTWNIPTLVGNRLLVRNDREAALFRLPLR